MSDILKSLSDITKEKKIKKEMKKEERGGGAFVNWFFNDNKIYIAIMWRLATKKKSTNTTLQHKNNIPKVRNN